MPGVNMSGPMRNAAVVILTKSLANALGPHGINVNCIYPGTTITEAGMERMESQAQRRGTTVEALLKEVEDALPTRHIPTSEDIAYFVAFLCSPLAIGMTGESFAVSGGAGADVHF
jgi:NAD(P)-dependent dehydrogenase (short-subunit alcohol dehydrogenase family)